MATSEFKISSVFYIASVVLPHTEPTLLPHVCLAFFLRSTVYSYSRQRVFNNAPPS